MKVIVFALAVGLIGYPFFEVLPVTTDIILWTIGALIIIGMFPRAAMGLIVLTGGGIIGITLINEYNNGFGFILMIATTVVGFGIILPKIYN